LATKPDGEVSGLGDHQHERALQSNPVPRPLHDANPKLTRAWPLTLKHSGDLGVATKEPRKGRPAATGRELLRLVKWPWGHGPLEPLFD